MARFTGLGNSLHRRIALGGVIVRNEDQRQRHRQADQRRQVVTHSTHATHAGHDRVRHGVERDRGNATRHKQPLIERRHDLAAGAHLHEENADDRRKDRHAAEGERIENRRAVSIE